MSTCCKGKRVGSLRNKRIAVSHIGITWLQSHIEKLDQRNIITMYASSHNHGSVKKGMSPVVTFQIQHFSTSNILFQCCDLTRLYCIELRITKVILRRSPFSKLKLTLKHPIFVGPPNNVSPSKALPSTMESMVAPSGVGRFRVATWCPGELPSVKLTVRTWK